MVTNEDGLMFLCICHPALDPTQLLKALNPLLGPTGAILGPTEATRIASLMKDASKMVSKCVYLNILKLETSKETMEKFLSIGGWGTLNDWLQGFKEADNYPLLAEILKVYRNLPVTVEILKTNNAAKTIKQLCKSENESVKILATNIFEEWMKKVKKNNNNNSNTEDPKVKKKKKEKEKKDEGKGESSKTSDKSSIKSDSKTDSKSDSKSDSKIDKDSKSDSKIDRDSKSDKSKLKDAKSSHHHHSHHRHHSGDHSLAFPSNSKDKDKERKLSTSQRDRKSVEDSDSSSNHSGVSEDSAVVRKGSGLKLHIKLGDREKMFDKSQKSDLDRKRPSTVKRPPSKFRSTGLEEQTVPSKTKLPDKQQPPKRTSTDLKSEPPVKKSRLHMPPPLSVPSPVTMTTSSVTTPTSTSPTSPGEIHGKIKLIPARPKPNHSIHDSSGFMDSLNTARTYGAFKKKRKAMAAAASGNGPSTPTGKVPTTPPSPVSPTTAVARSLPAVPSFYKDTLVDPEPSPEKEVKERTPSPVEGDEPEATTTTTTPDDSKDDTTPVKMDLDDDDEGGDYDPEDKERSISPDSLTDGNKETKGLLTTGATKRKKKKKNVRWKDDHELKEVFYFELDEEERVNVNRPKDFNQAKKNEMMNDRRVMESARRLINDNMVEQIAWYRPKLIAGLKDFEYGKESTEKNIQKVREQGVLQALFFNRNMLPDGPQEPDIMHEEAVETKIIPVEDVSGGDEFLYNYEQHAEAVKTPPADSWQQQQQPPLPPPGSQRPPMNQPMPQQPIPPPPMMNLPPGMNLPPELMGLLSQIQNMPPDQSGPVMAQVQQILANIMMGGTDQNYEQLQQIHQMMSAQMGMPPEGMMPGPPPPMGMPPMGMPPGGPPMGPRNGLLGNAPPGFMPQRPMGPPNRFGGPGPPGNWNDGPMGPGGPGPGGPGPGGPRGQNSWGSKKRRGSGPWGRGGGRGGGGGGGPPSFSKNLCRHFANGSCHLGSECGFLHPGINGPPLKDNKGDS